MDTIYEMMVACVVFHNMIIKYEKNDHLKPLFQQENIGQLRQGLTFDSFMQNNQEIENSQTHFNLRLDLVEHLLAMKGFLVTLALGLRPRQRGCKGAGQD
jgi:hypothetical protein